MLSIFYHCVCHDLKIVLRKPAAWVHPILFFILFISLFGIALGFEKETLIKISPAIIWIAFLLTSLFTIETVLRREMASGALEQLLLSPYPLWWLMLAKSTAIWIVSCLALIFFVPVLGLFMHLSWYENSILFFSLLIGSPAITLIGMIGAALTLALPSSGLFLGLLLLPLYVPILILGESTLAAMLSSSLPSFQLALLGAISMLTLSLAPHGVAAALRVAMD
ncbi:MAG: heme exporter protein CcmB [Proteobacteria bacterium]|nr:heme exporter protein CcmB [Pseudomonadota bacterium]